MDDIERLFLKEAGLVNMQEAMRDPVVAEVVESAKERALEINIQHNWMVPDDYVDKTGNVQEFDERTKYLYETMARVSGAAEPVHTDLDPIYMDEAAVKFLGFIECIKDGTLEYRYLFEYYVDLEQEGEVKPLSLEGLSEIVSEQADSRVGGMGATSSFDSLHIDFETMHPQRSMAWLQENSPGVIDEIDQRILDKHGDFSEKSILNLRGMNVVPSETMDDRSRERYFTSVSEYINYMLSVDKNVPYLIKIKCPDYLANSLDIEKFEWVKKTDLYVMNVEDIRVSILNIDNGEVRTEIGPSLIIRGVISDPADLDAPAVGTLFILDDVENIISMRKTQMKLITSLGRTGLAK